VIAFSRYSTLCIYFLCFAGFAQNRISEKNNIGWLAFTGTFQLTGKIGVHAEYQWRRDNYVQNWQQGLLRLGINYRLKPEIELRAGYAWAETFPYGDYPINGFGKDFTEQRIFEMATLKSEYEPVTISHRFMLEQRWVGRYSDASLDSEDSYVYTNRLRYMLRLQMPLYKNGPYVAVYDEIFCGFGGNIGENIFDQNRFGALIGKQISRNIRIEGGYLNQIVMFGREIDGKNVFQNNNGFIVSGILNFDVRKGISSYKK
jgi:hypothetical protein